MTIPFHLYFVKLGIGLIFKRQWLFWRCTGIVIIWYARNPWKHFFCAVTFILLLNNNYLNQFIHSQFPSYHFIQGNYNIDMQLKTRSRLVRLPKCTCLFSTSMLTCLIKCNTKRVQLNTYKSVMVTNYTVAYKLLSL